MKYRYNIRKKAMKFIQKQNAEQQKRIFRAIYLLPLTGDIKKLSGTSQFRLRVGDYRILFDVVPETNELTRVDITDAGNRRQIYNDV